MANMNTVAQRSGKAIGGGALWRIMRGTTCAGTIVHTLGLWIATPTGVRFTAHETQAEALAVFGI